MNELAQGFVEVSSYVAAVEAADAMSKGADVTVTRVHKVDGPILTIICEGDVAACKAAVDAASALCAAKGALLGANVIPRPEDGRRLYECLDEINAKKAAKKAARLAARSACRAPSVPDEACGARAAGRAVTPEAAPEAAPAGTPAGTQDAPKSGGKKRK